MKSIRFLLVSTVIIVNNLVSAQNCDPLALLSQPAQIKRMADVERRSAFTADLPAIDKVVNYIDKVFEVAFKPKGLKVERFANYTATNKYQGENRKINTRVHTSSYNYNIYNFAYYCSNRKQAVEGETSLRMYMYINSGLDRMPNDTVPVYDYDGAVYRQVPLGFYDLLQWFPGKALPILKNGVYTFSQGEGQRRTITWLITANDKLPFKYVTRKDFLQKRILISKAVIKEFKNQATHPMVIGACKEIADYEADLKKPADWLNEMSIVRYESVKDYYRYVFTTLDVTGNPAPQVPVQPDYNYFNKNIPAPAPQYIVIKYTNSGNHPEAENFRKSIELNMDKFIALVTTQATIPVQNKKLDIASVKKVETISNTPDDNTKLLTASAEHKERNSDPHTVLFEDFKGVAHGGHPPGWVVNNTLPRPTIHQLEKLIGHWLLIPPRQTLSLANTAALPEKFTIEYDLFFTNTQASQYNYYTLVLTTDKANNKRVMDAGNRPVFFGESEFRFLVNVDRRYEKYWVEHSKDKMSTDGRVQVGKMNFAVTAKDKPTRVSITVDGRAVIAKVNNQVVIDDAQYLPEGIRFKKYAFAVPGTAEGYGIYLSNLFIKSATPVATKNPIDAKPKADVQVVKKEIKEIEHLPYSTKYLTKLNKLPALIYPKGITPMVEKETNEVVQPLKATFKFPEKSEKLNSLSRSVLSKAAYMQYTKQLVAIASSKLKQGDLANINNYIEKMNNPSSVQLSSIALETWIKGGSLAAVYLFGKALEKDPKDLHAANNLSALLINNGYAEKAVPLLNYVNKEVPAHPIVLVNLANAYYNLGDFTTASSFAEQCLQKEEDNLEANKIKAFLLIRKATQKQGVPDKTDMGKAIVCLKQGLQSRYDDEASRILNRIEKGHRRTKDFHTTNNNEFSMLKAIQLPAIPGNLAEMKSFNAFIQGERKSLFNTAAVISKLYTQQNEKRGKQSFTISQDYAIAAMMHKAASLFTENAIWFTQIKNDLNAIFQYRRNEINQAYNIRTTAIAKKYNEQMNKLEGGERGEEEDLLAELEKAKCAELNNVNQERLVELAQITHEYARKMEYAARTYCRDYANWGPLQLIDDRVDTRNVFFLYAQKEYLKEIGEILSRYPTTEPCVAYDRNIVIQDSVDVVLKEWEEEWCASMDFKIKLAVVSLESDCHSISIEGGEGILGGIKITLDENTRNVKEVTITAGLGIDKEVGGTIATVGAGVAAKQFITLETGKDGNIKVKEWGSKVEASVEARVGEVGKEVTILESTNTVTAGTRMGGTIQNAMGWNL